jgi:hypothetical protein
MKKTLINVTAQAKAIRAICDSFISVSVSTCRYLELVNEIESNETISLLVHKIGEAMIKEESDFERAIETSLLRKDYASIDFGISRYALTHSRELTVALKHLMGWHSTPTPTPSPTPTPTS